MMPYYNTYRGSKSLPRKRSKSPTNLVPFRSANPAQLQEISSMNNHQLDYTDDDAVGALSKMGHVSPFRTRTMKEYDQQISELKKENFSLKLRVYFVEERLRQKFATCGKEEDIGKENIELKIELESLKRDLVDKQELLCAASQALETLENQHQIELKNSTDKSQKDKEHFEQRIGELEKQLERVEGPQVGISKRHSEEWFRQAFSVADLTVDNNERTDQKTSDMEVLFAEMNNKIQMYEETIQEMKSATVSKDERITKLEKDKLKRNSAIQGLMEAVQEKNRECDDLTNQLEVQSETTRTTSSGSSVTMRNGAAISYPMGDRISECQQSEVLKSDAAFQHDTLLFEVQVKDNKISDLCEQLKQLQVELESQADACLRKDELISKLQDSLSSAERNFEELLAQANKITDYEKIIEALKLDLCEKEKEAQDAESKFSSELNDIGERLSNSEKELERVNCVLQELENDVRHKADENKSYYNLLLERKDSIANLQEKLRMKDECFKKIGSCLDKMLFEDIDLTQENVLLEDEKVFHVLDDFSKLSKILRKVTILCVRDSAIQNLEFQMQSPLPDSALPKSGLLSPVELHHFDLIRDSHAQESAASLLAANLRLKKEVANLQTELKEASHRNKLLEEQLGSTQGQMDLLLRQTEEMNLSGKADELKEERNMESEKLANELKKEMSKLKRELEMMHQLNGLLQQQIDLRPVNQLPTQKDVREDLLSSLSTRTQTLREQMMKLGSIPETVARDALHSTSENQRVEDKVSNNDKIEAEVNRLKFNLQSTEATVRMLGNKVKYYRLLLAEAGVVVPLTGCKTSHRSNPNIANPWASQTNRTTALMTLTVPPHHRLHNGVVGCPLVEEQTFTPFFTLCKSASFSAPVTPIRGVPNTAMDHSEANSSTSQLEGLEALRRSVEDKDQLLDKLKLEIEQLRLPPPATMDASCQSDSTETPLAVDADACRRIAESHHTSEILRRRLQELADFLESLLHFDGNGMLDLSSLTPHKLASIRSQLEKTRELSCTLSQSLMALDNTFPLSDLSDAGQKSAVHESTIGSSSGSSISGHERDGYTTLVNSPADGADKFLRAPKSCSRSLALGSSISGQREIMEDNYIMILQPNTNAFSGALSVDVADELPTCSLSAFGLQHSFLSSTNVFESSRKKREDLSESDSWSEPDRHVSQQRIGLQSTQVTLSGCKMVSSSNTESELATEFSGFPIHRSRNNKSVTPGKGNPQLSSSVFHMLAQTEGTEELNASFNAKPVLTHSTFGSPLATAKQTTYSPPLKPQRRLRSRSGDLSSSGKSPLKIDCYLREISELKKRLEESIRAYDLLREQFEKLLTASPTGNTELNEEYASVIQKLYEQLEDNKAKFDSQNLMIQDARKEKALLLEDIQDLTEKFESYKETIESLQSMLGEQQQTSKESFRKVECLEAAVEERERELAEARAAREQSQQSLTRAKQLVRDNESALKNLRDLSMELEAECDRLRCECKRMEQDGRCREQMMAQLNKQAEELKMNVGCSQKFTRELEEERNVLQYHMRELQHSISMKEEESTRTSREMQLCLASKQRELEEMQRAKLDMEFRLTELQTQLETASALNQSLKIELQMYEKIGAERESNPRKVDELESGVDLLMSEVRTLHKQLERSVETNQALKAKLEKKASTCGESGRLHLDIGEGIGENGRNERWSCPVSSPDTASSFSYVSGRCQNTCSEQADVYSSPDLGIESDRSRLSSLDRKNSTQKSPYLQPAFPGCNDWTVVNSAPPRLTAAKKISYSTSGTRYQNLTFPACGKATTNESGAELAEEDRKPYFIAFPADHGALKKAIYDGLNLLRTVRSKAKERLLVLKSDATATKTVKNEEYAAWKEAYLGCDALKACLQEGCHLLGKLWMAPLPLVPFSSASRDASAIGGEENQLCLEEELMRLYHELAKEKLRAETALEKLENAKRKEAKMEKFIMKELKKTHSVLKMTGGKMEQQAKCISNSPPHK